MLETPHALVGAAIAAKIPNPVISLPLAFASHFILDMVPHWNPHLNTELKTFGKISKRTNSIIVTDVLLALVSGSLMAFLFSDSTPHTINILLGAFAGVLPDLLEAPYYFFKSKSKAIIQWIHFQKSIQSDTSILPGLTTQIATAIAAIWWVAGS
jgi:hypothetical protein